MNNLIKRFFILNSLFLIYKISLDFIFLPTYYKTFSYMLNAVYEYSFNKFILSYIIFFVMILFLAILSIKREDFYIMGVIFYVLSVIPMLSVYAFVNYVKFDSILYPVIFWCILIIGLSKDTKKRIIIRFPALKYASKVMLTFCIVGTLLCWGWAGCPILTNLSHSIAQRLELRAKGMPVLLGYLFVVLGGVVVPYLFARFLDKKRTIYSILTLGMGFLLYSVNGMKTWFFLYLAVIGIYLVSKVCKNNVRKISYFIIFLSTLFLIISIQLFLKYNIIDLMNQVGRVVCIPNGIGFKSVSFFKENELLYLRESVLRHFCETPYPGGSDFYMNYGVNSTINSSRSNNGLWGDATRNFGFIGIIIYPIFIAKIFNIIEYSVRKYSVRFKVFIFFLMIWNSINVSFFTWLLTGGVFIILFLTKIFKKEDRYIIYERKKIKYV